MFAGKKGYTGAIVLHQTTTYRHPVLKLMI